MCVCVCVCVSLCYPLMWNATLEYTPTHFNVSGQTRSGNPSRPSIPHIPANAHLFDANVVVVSQKLGRDFDILYSYSRLRDAV